MKKAIPAVLVLVLFAGMGCGVSMKSRQKYVNTHPSLSPQIRQCILEKKIVSGMTSEEVIASRGKPEKEDRTVDSKGVHSQWIYMSKWEAGVLWEYVYFEDGVVTSVRKDFQKGVGTGDSGSFPFVY
jgi:hypothetical protein